jgi:hypothetical protein
MRAHGLIVDDIPQHLAPDPSTMTHSIFVPSSNLRVPLALKGTVSRIVTHYPSTEELQTCEWVELTTSEPWEPSSSLFEENEARVQNSLDEEPSHNNRYICNITSKAFEPELNLFPCSIQRRINSLKSQSRSHSSHLKNQVSTVFGVGLETAERTLQATTQLALWNAIHPVHHRFRTEVAQLHYPRLGGPHGGFHTDNFFASHPSLSRCTMGQMYTNNVHFTKFYPR